MYLFILVRGTIVIRMTTKENHLSYLSYTQQGKQKLEDIMPSFQVDNLKSVSKFLPQTAKRKRSGMHRELIR